MSDNHVRTALYDTSLLLIRLVLAAVFLYHGSQKLFGLFGGPGMEGWTQYLAGMENPYGFTVPYPEISAWLSACTEFIGGLLLLIGLLTRLAALALAINMIMAIVMVHSGAFSLQNQGMEYALTLAVVLVALLLSGPGRFSIDGAIWGRRRHRPVRDRDPEDVHDEW